MEKLGVKGPFQLVGEHIHTKLWKLVPWHLVRLGNLDVFLQRSVDVPVVERESAAAQARPRIAGDTGHPWGVTQPFGSFQGALWWCCGHTEARQNNRTCSTSSKQM